MTRCGGLLPVFRGIWRTPPDCRRTSRSPKRCYCRQAAACAQALSPEHSGDKGIVHDEAELHIRRIDRPPTPWPLRAVMTDDALSLSRRDADRPGGRQRDPWDDRKAFEEAYTAHKDRLLTLAAALTGDRSTAEDVVHDVFASLIKEPKRLRDNPRLPAFLAVCVRNRAFDLHRRNSRQKLHIEMRAAQEAEAAGHNPEEQPAWSEERDALLGLVPQLPDNLRELLCLRVGGDLTFQQIAAVQGTTRSTAHARYRQALAELRTRQARAS